MSVLSAHVLAHVTPQVPRNAAALAREHKGCTIMFMDIVGFTSMCKMVPPQDVLFFLNNLFSICDGLTDKHGVHKVRALRAAEACH